MANPQLENGHIRVANELYRRALLVLPASKFKVWFAVVDLTYGWGKKQDRIAYSQIATATGMCVREVRRHTRELIEWNVLLRQPYSAGTIPVMGPNKDYDTWNTPGGIQPGLKTTGVENNLTPRLNSTYPPGGNPPTPPVENVHHQNHREPYRDKESQGASASSSDDSKHLSHPLVLAYRDLFCNGGNIPTNQKQSTVRAMVELQELPEWNTEEAVTILRRLQKHEATRVAGKSFAYLAKPIADHLANGTMPGGKKQTAEDDDRKHIDEWAKSKGIPEGPPPSVLRYMQKTEVVNA